MPRLPDRARVRAIVRATIVVWLAGLGAAPAWAANLLSTEKAASIERALAMLQEGASGKDVVAILEPLAYENDRRAQLLLGSVYFDGRGMPRDMVQGYAWLAVAATSVESKIAGKAKDMLLADESELSGGDLSRADQRAASIRSTIAERLYERYLEGVRQFTTERPNSLLPWITFGREPVQLAPPIASQTNRSFRIGCASAANRGCSSKSQAVEGPRCTGRIVEPDTGPSMMPGEETYTPAPDYSVEIRRSGVSGTTIIVVHVDRSGWVCGAAIAESSGVPSLDAVALSAVTLWRLKPATRQGEAVEALHLLAVSYNL